MSNNQSSNPFKTLKTFCKNLSISRAKFKSITNDLLNDNHQIDDSDELFDQNSNFNDRESLQKFLSYNNYDDDKNDTDSINDIIDYPRHELDEFKILKFDYLDNWSINKGNSNLSGEKNWKIRKKLWKKGSIINKNEKIVLNKKQLDKIFKETYEKNFLKINQLNYFKIYDNLIIKNLILKKGKRINLKDLLILLSIDWNSEKLLRKN